MKVYPYFSPILLCFLIACKTHFTAVSHTENIYTVQEIAVSDTLSAVESFLKPYRDSLSGIMNVVIGTAEGDFHKEKDGGSLGNLITDAMMVAASKQKTCQGAIFNTGGIRLPDLMHGNITKGKILELLPFDNELVIMQIKGDILEKWLNTIAEKGGWPVKLGSLNYLAAQHTKYTYQIPSVFKQQKIFETPCDTVYTVDKEGLNWRLIACIAIQKDSVYNIATNDYIANGGDQCDFLKNQPRFNTGLLIRDMLYDYIQKEKNIKPDQNKRLQFNNSSN